MKELSNHPPAAWSSNNTQNHVQNHPKLGSSTYKAFYQSKIKTKFLLDFDLILCFNLILKVPFYISKQIIISSSFHY